MFQWIYLFLPGCMLCFCTANLQSASGPDMAIDATVSSDPAPVGQDLKYTVTVINHGDAVAAGILITNLVDSRLSIKAVNPTHGTISISDSIVVNSIDSLAAQEEAKLEITVVPLEANIVIFSATVMISSPEVKLFDNNWTMQTEVIGVPNLPPSVTIDSPQENVEIVSGGDLEITANANDSDGSIGKVEFFLQDVKLAEQTTPPFTLKVPGLRPGSYTLTVRTTDDLQAVATAQCHVTATGGETNKFLFPKYENGVFSFSFMANYFDDFAIQSGTADGNW